MSDRTIPHRIEPADRPPAARDKTWLRVGLAMLAAAGVLVGGGVLARAWVNQQYYVGASQDRVAIFQGVQGKVPVFGTPLYEVATDGQTNIALADLPENLRSQVNDGIRTPEGHAQAQATVARLREQMLPDCVPRTPVPPPTPAPPAAPGQPPAAAAPGSPNDPVAAETPVPVPAPQPGITCRPVS